MRTLWIALLALLIAPMTYAQGQSMPNDPIFAEGQVWAIHGRAQDDNPMIRIAMIEDHPVMGRIYHISVIGVRIGDTTQIGHLPVARKTMEASIIARVDSESDFPDATEGIALWRADQGGVFTIPIADILNVLEGVMSSDPPPPHITLSDMARIAV